MKRLNQNITIATTAMLTKTNTMKDKMNLFAKVVMIVVMMVMLVLNKINAAGPAYCSETGYWYAAYDGNSEHSEKGSWGGAAEIRVANLSSICAPYQNKIAFQIAKSGAATIFDIKVYQSNTNGNWQEITSYGQGNIPAYDYGKGWGTKTLDINSTTRYIRFYKTVGTLYAYERCAGILLAPHVYAAQNNATITKNVSVTQCDQSPKEETIYLYSFLCQNACTLRIEKVSDPNNCFTCEGSYSITANSCGYTGGTDGNLKNLQDYPFRVKYTPTASGNHTATFKITDGTNESAIITVNGSCTVKQPTIQWKTLPSFETTTSPTTYKVSDYLDLTNCQIGDLTFSSSDNDAIEVYQHSDGNYYFRVNSGSTGHYDATITAEVECGAKALFATSAQTPNIHVNKVDPTFDWNTIPQFCVANPAPQGFVRSYSIPDNAFGPTGIDLNTANPTLSVPVNQSLTVSGRDITVSSKAGKVNLSMDLSETYMTNAKTFTKDIFVDHYGEVMNFGRCYVLELNSPDGHTMPADVNLSNIIDATTFTSVSSSEVDFRPSLNSTSLHVDFLPSSYSTTDQASNIRNGVITVVSGNGEYHVTVKGYSVPRYPTFEATMRGYYSDSVVFQNVFYDPNANTQTYISIPDNGHHYQYYNIAEGKWKMLGRRENDQSVHGFYIDNSTRDTFSLRFAPTDLWRDNQGVIAGKGSSLVITCGDDERSVFVTAQPLRYDLILDPNQSFDYIATDGQHTIDRSLFQITMPNEKRNVDCGIPNYNTDTYRNMIVFSLIDGSDVISLNGNNINISKAGTAHILATLSPSETPDAQGKWGDVNNFEEATCTLTVNVARAVREDFVWTKPDGVMVFGSYPFSVTPAETTGVVGSVSYEVYPEGAVTIGNGQIKFNNCSTVTVKAILPETDTYERMEKTQIYTPAKVTPVLNWVQGDLSKKIGDDYTFTPATWTNTQGEPDINEWAEGEVTINYTSSKSGVAHVSGSKIVFDRAGLTTITAAIPEEKNHNASTDNPSKSVKVDFADAGINLGNEMYVGETSPLTYDITDMIVPAGALKYTTTDNDFSVDFSNNKIVVVYNPSVYHETSSGTITFTDTDGQEYHLNVTAGCVKHTPVIEWKDDKTLALSANPEMKSLNELLKNCSYCDGATIKTSDATVVMVFKSDETPAGEGEGGTLFWARGNGPAIITIEIPETESHTSATSQETFTVSGVEDTRIEWSQSLYFDTDEPDVKLTAVAYPLYGNTPTNQTITYQLISNDDNAVSLLQGTDGKWYLAMNNVGTATIKAIASASSNYNSSESPVRTITINEPAQTGECIITFDDVTESARTYNFVLDGHDDNDYYYVDKIAYHYYVKGDTKVLWSGGDDRTIKATVKDINNSTLTYSKEYTASAAHAVSGGGEEKNDNESIPINNGDLLKSIEFSGDIGTNNSAFTNIVVTPSKYLKATSTTSHTFGNPTAIFVGQSETVQLTIAEYAFLNGNQVDMKLVNLNDDGDYAGGEFTILDKSDGDDWGNPCDYGKIKVHVQFAPLSGKDNAVHKCRIKMTGTIGTNSTSPVYFTLEGHAQRNQQQVIWTQDLSGWNSRTGEVILAASSNQNDVTGTMGYEIVSQSAATSRETTGVVDIIDGNRLKIYKAGTVTIKAKHPGDDKYLPAELECTFTISRVDPDINLSHNSTDIAASSQIEVTLGEAPYTITGCAKYVGNVIPGYATGTGGKITFTSGATGVVSIVEDNKLKFNSAGTATITASIAEDDTVNAANITFDVKVNPSDQVVTITNDLTKKLVTTDTEDGITLTATAVNAHDGTMASDGIISYEITSGGEYADIVDNKLVSKKNGVGSITVVAHSSQTSNYNAGTSEPVVFSMEKATPTITWTTAPGATMTFTDRMQIEATTNNDDGEKDVYYLISSAGGTASPEQRTDGIWEIVPSKVGMIEITPKILETTNYLPASGETKQVNITNGLVTFTIADISMHYGDPELTITPQTDGLKGYDATYTIESSDYQYIANTSGKIVDGKINVLNAHPGQPITVTPSFTLANYTISCAPFTVTIDKAEQSLTWNPTTSDISATFIGASTTNFAPQIRFTYQGIENDITYSYDNQYINITPISGNVNQISVSLLQYSPNPIAVTASFAGNENIEAASTAEPLMISMVLQPQKVEWDGVAPTISNIYTTNSTTESLVTLKAKALAKVFEGPTGNVVKFRVEENDNCPSSATLVTLVDNGDNSFDVKYTGNGSGHIKIIAYAETGNGYQATDPEDEKTIEFDVLPSPATVSWTSTEFADAHYGDIITMTPTISPDKGDKVFAYTFEEGKNLTCQGNVLSIKDVATEGTTITARNTEDCFLAADVDGYTRSVTINKTGQEIVWNQSDMTLDVIGSSDVQLTAYAIDSRHKVQENTCLTLTDGKYITAKTAGDDNVTPSETGMKVTYIVEEQDGVCKVSDEKIVTVNETGLLRVTGNGTGQVKITPTVSEGTHYTSKTGTPIIVTVSKVTPTVTVTGPVGPLNYGTGPHTLTASSVIDSYSSVDDHNAAFTYTITEGTDVASISGDQLTILKAGTVKVTATQTANCIVNSATSEGYEITISPATPTIAWTDPCSAAMNLNYREEKQLTFSCNYTGYNASYTLTEPSDDTYVDITELANGMVKIIGVKPNNETIDIKVTISDPVGNYSDGELTTAITTQKNNTEIDWNGQSFGTYTTADAGTEIELVAYVKDLYKNDNSGEAVSYDFKGTDMVANCGNIVELTDDGKLKITGDAVGTVTLYANYAGNDNYNESTEKSMQITVGKQTPRFEWTDNTGIQAIYGDVNVSAGEITKDGDGVVTYSSSNEAIATIDENGNITIVGAGITTISATLAADNCKYEAVTTAITKTLTVGKAACTITVTNPQTIQFGQTETLLYTTTNTDQNLQVTFTSGNVNIVSISENQVTGAGAGTIYVYAEIAESDNYLYAKSDDFNITVTQVSQIFTIDDIALTYGDVYQTVAINDGGITGYTVSYSIVDADKSYISFNADGTINAIGANYDAQGNLVNIPVTAQFTSTNYSIADVTFNVTVKKADPTLTPDPASLSLHYPTDLENGQNVTIEVTNPDDVTNFTFVDNDNVDIATTTTPNIFNVKPQEKAVTETLTFHYSSANYNEGSVNVPVTVSWDDMDLQLDGTKLSNLTSTDIVDLDTITGFVHTNYPDNVTFTYEIEDLSVSGMATISDGVLTLSKEGSLVVKVTATHSPSGKSDEKSVTCTSIGKGTLIFNVAEGSDDNKWTNPANWSRPDIVTSHTDIGNNSSDLSEYNVQINDSCFIGKDPTPEGTEPVDESEWETHKVAAACNNLKIDGTDAKLVIGEASTLNVKGNLNNTDASKLVLTANYWGQASVVFNSGSPKATIEMYIPEGNGSKTDPIWQYRGICVSEFAPITQVPVVNEDGNPIAGETINPWSYVYVYEWDESQNADLTHGCWVNGRSGSNITEDTPLQPWKGYCFANMMPNPISELWLTYTGTLINSATHEYNLTKTPSGRDIEYANYGVNLLTNSYTAPMTIGDIVFGDNDNNNDNDEAYATVTFYNAGTHADWAAHHTDAGTDTTMNRHGEHPGQMTACPKYTSGEAQNTFTIPAGQSFFVTAKSDGNIVKFNYSDIIADLGPSRRMFLPGERENKYNVLGIRVNGKENGDRLVLLECETCTRQYDNGYDGYKMLGKEGLPQIYAYNKFGNTAVNADSTLNKQYVGFMAGSDDETYTISFETDKLFGYHSLYLTDRKLNETVDILAGETYQFKGYTVGENMRFQINGITEQEWNNENDDDDDNDDSNVCDLRIVGNTLYVQGFTTDHYPAARVELFDMTGNSVWSTPLTSERLYDLPQLPQGIYTVRLGDCHVKYVTK